MVFQYFLSGFLLGLTAGISPGPLQTLIVSQTLKHRLRDGIKVALAPLFVDTPIIIASLLLFSYLASLQAILGIIALLGGLFLLYLSYESVTTRGCEIYVTESAPHSLLKGILVNFLSPHPYLFWTTVGSPIILKAYGESAMAAAAFIGAFYLMLVGSKVMIAVIVSQFRGVLRSRGYIWVMRILGMMLFIFALMFFRDAVELLGILH